MSKELPTPEQICGKCILFRTTTRGGEPVGAIEIEPGKIVKRGLCGAEFGLLLQGLNETTRCMQTPSPLNQKKK